LFQFKTIFVQLIGHGEYIYIFKLKFLVKFNFFWKNTAPVPLVLYWFWLG